MFQEKKLRAIIENQREAIIRKEKKIEELDLRLREKLVEGLPTLPEWYVCNFCGVRHFNTKKYKLFRNGLEKLAVCNICLKK